MKRRSLRATTLVVLALALVATPILTTPAQASEPFLGQIMIVGFNFAPRGWSTCAGQLLAISSNTALFSLLGTTFGGDGRTNFALPDLRGRTAFGGGMGSGPGLSPINQGQRGGLNRVTLTVLQIPSHNHTATGVVRATSAAGNTEDPAGNVLAQENREDQYRNGGQVPDVNMAADTVNVTVNHNGGGQGHENMPPYLGLYHNIALQGIFPSRN